MFEIADRFYFYVFFFIDTLTLSCSEFESYVRGWYYLRTLPANGTAETETSRTTLAYYRPTIGLLSGQQYYSDDDSQFLAFYFGFGRLLVLHL